MISNAAAIAPREGLNRGLCRGPGTKDQGPGTRDRKPGTGKGDRESRNWGPETRVRDRKQETRTEKPGTGDRETRVGDRKLGT